MCYLCIFSTAVCTGSIAVVAGCDRPCTRAFGSPAVGHGTVFKTSIDAIHILGITVADDVAEVLNRTLVPLDTGTGGGHTVISDGQIRENRALGLGGELHLVAPSALTVNAAAVGAHLHGVGGVVGEFGEGVGVGGHVDEVVLVVVEAELPSGGAAVLGPAQLDAVGGGLASGEGCGSEAGNACGEADDVALVAGAAGALADYLHLIRSLAREVIERIGLGSGGAAVVPAGDTGRNHDVVHIEAVVAAIDRTIFLISPREGMLSGFNIIGIIVKRGTVYKLISLLYAVNVEGAVVPIVALIGLLRRTSCGKTNCSSIGQINRYGKGRSRTADVVITALYTETITVGSGIRHNPRIGGVVCKEGAEVIEVASCEVCINRLVLFTYNNSICIGVAGPVDGGSVGGDAVLVEGHHGSQTVGLGGKLHLVAPEADAVNAAAVGAHLDGVGGVVVETVKGEGVGGHVDEVLLIAVETELPSSLLSTSGPAQLHVGGGGLTGSK